MRHYKLINNIVGWLVFAIATYTYVATIEPTASFWDCGEYIACSHKLEVGHPPGAPFFLLIGRLFILLGGDDPATAAKWVNIMSALCSSFTILFLYWSITRLGVKISNLMRKEFTTPRMLAVITSGVIGGLAYAFSDSFWFSAVEGEVYAMSSLFTAVAFWAILKWEEEADNASSVRWLIFLAYLIGLSIGVHLLNLLVIPAICFIYYFRKYKFTFPGFLLCGVISIVLLGGIQGVMIPNIVKFSADYELSFVNSFGLPFNLGTIFYFILLISGLIVGILYSVKRTNTLFTVFMVIVGLFAFLSIICGVLSKTNSGLSLFLRLVGFGGIITALVLLKKKPQALHHILVSVSVLLLGYSTFFVLVIRSQANTPMDENNPENAISLLSYLNREQYGDWPILKGNYYNAELDEQEPYVDGTPIYGKDTTEGKYVVIDDRKASIPNYDKRFVTWFPRMWSTQGGHAAAYEHWGNVSGRPSGKVDENGNDIMVPTFAENLTYFKNYQLGYMYWRYFGWNFIGRQNDIQGLTNNVTEGNVYSGIDWLDKKFTGLQDLKITPYNTQRNKANNKFYCLPLILGLIGLVFHVLKNPKDFFVCMLLFFFTGIAIVIYLNQYPFQPRERDYAYAASFYSFAIWIGLGAMAIFETLRAVGDKITRSSDSSKGAGGFVYVAATAGMCFFVPYLMAKEGWDDHDRSKRTMSRDFAINYLQSCEKNAVLFTNGDNDTFPLWYVQEVEGIRTDVRVVNLSLLQTDWYINQMRRAAYDSPPVPFTLDPKKYEGSKREVVYLFQDPKVGYENVKDVIDFIASDDPNDKKYLGGRYLDYVPTKKFRLPVYGNSKDSLKNIQDSIRISKIPGLIPPGMEKRMVKNVEWETTKGYITKNDLMILDLLNGFKWERPVYFAVTTGPEAYLNLQDYFQLEGLAYRLVPIKSTREEMVHQTRVYSEKMYANIMNEDPKKWAWGGMQDTTGAGTNLDENCLRMALNMRIQMTTLASVLIQENKKDKAKKVLDKMMTVMPEKNVPYDATLYTAVGCYYKLDMAKEAGALAKKLFDIFEWDAKFYLNLDGDTQISYQREMRQCKDIMQGLRDMSLAYKQMDQYNDFKARYANLFGQEEMPTVGPGKPGANVPLNIDTNR